MSSHRRFIKSRTRRVSASRRRCSALSLSTTDTRSPTPGEFPEPSADDSSCDGENENTGRGECRKILHLPLRTHWHCQRCHPTLTTTSFTLFAFVWHKSYQREGQSLTLCCASNQLNSTDISFESDLRSGHLKRYHFTSPLN